MEITNHKAQISQNPEHYRYRQEQGFALVSLTMLIPLLFTVVAAVAFSFYSIKKKSLAQALCVRQGVQMQAELAKSMEELLRLNPAAKTLRIEKKATQIALIGALASGFPPAIAAAEAADQAVRIAQILLAARQWMILYKGEQIKNRHISELKRQLRKVGAEGFSTSKIYPFALSVRPTPIGSLSPSYKPLPNFQFMQAEKFRFTLNLAPKFKIPFLENLTQLKQTTECSVSLEKAERKNQWRPKIVAAKPFWNWL